MVKSGETLGIRACITHENTWKTHENTWKHMHSFIRLFVQNDVTDERIFVTSLRPWGERFNERTNIRYALNHTERMNANSFIRSGRSERMYEIHWKSMENNEIRYFHCIFV